MSIRANSIGALVACALMFTATASADDAPALRNNPFSRPPSVVTATVVSESRFDADPSGLDLRATLVGSRGKLANVAGKTVRPGDEIQGYTLVQVFEDRAVFKREGNRLTVFVKPELEENDED